MAVSGGVPCRQFVSIVVQCMFVVSVGRLIQCVSVIAQCMCVVSVARLNSDSLSACCRTVLVCCVCCQINADSLCLLLYGA